MSFSTGTGTLRCWYLLYPYAMVLCVLYKLKDKGFYLNVVFLAAH